MLHGEEMGVQKKEKYCALRSSAESRLTAFDLCSLAETYSGINGLSRRIGRQQTGRHKKKPGCSLGLLTMTTRRSIQDMVILSTVACNSLGERGGGGSESGQLHRRRDVAGSVWLRALELP